MKEFPKNPYAGGNYTRLAQGENRLRLFERIEGWEYWIDKNENVVPRGKRAGEGGKPIRVGYAELTDLPEDARMNAQFFRAYKVFNYQSGQFEIAEFKQRSIIEPLITLQYDDDWGLPEMAQYDIVVKRTGEGLETQYSVTPKPKKPFEHMDRDIKINLKALYKGEDPFEESTEKILEEVDVDIEEIKEDLDGKL